MNEYSLLMICYITDHIWYDPFIHWRRDECPPVRRRYFEIHFLEWKLLNFRWHFIEICSLGFNWQYIFIGSHTGLAPNRRQAIIWTNVSLVYWHMYATVSLNGLTSNAIFINDPPPTPQTPQPPNPPANPQPPPPLTPHPPPPTPPNPTALFHVCWF